ncbi:MAG: glycine cleavage system protein GcvH [Alphaproteobacteria bacterium]|nr:glycine cleavage system protein GcvH [Alphaproteobacteria bacterium]
MSQVRFTDQHEWVRVDGDIGTLGISDYAQQQLGDLVYVELPDVGKTVAKGDEIAVVESVKAASEIYAPVGGEVTEVNASVVDEPSAVNASPMDNGWLVKLKIADAAELEALMDEDAYKTYVDGLD